MTGIMKGKRGKGWLESRCGEKKKEKGTATSPVRVEKNINHWGGGKGRKKGEGNQLSI